LNWSDISSFFYLGKLGEGIPGSSEKYGSIMHLEIPPIQNHRIKELKSNYI